MKRISSGTKGLDEMLGGGFPEGRTILVAGGPGTGKTIFSLQYLMEAFKREESGVYATLEEPLEFIKQNVSAFGWNLEDAEEKGLFIPMNIRMSPYGKLVTEWRERRRDDPQISITDVLVNLARDICAKHIVVDPITSIVVHEQRSGMKRILIGQLFESLRKLDCTSVLTTEVVSGRGDFYMEEFLADGVIHLSKDIVDYKLVKTIRIEKMRGVDYDEQPRRYVITQNGLKVLYNEPVLV